MIVMNKNEESSSTIQKSLKKIWTSARRSINPLKSPGFESWFKRTDPGINLLANILSQLSHVPGAEARVLAANSKSYSVKHCRKLRQSVRNGSYIGEAAIWLGKERHASRNQAVGQYGYSVADRKHYRNTKKGEGQWESIWENQRQKIRRLVCKVKNKAIQVNVMKYLNSLKFYIRILC